VRKCLLRSEKVCKYFQGRNSRGFRRVVETVKAVDEIDLELRSGETVALVGESGSGKTTLGKTLIGILEATKGDVWFRDEKITHIKGAAWRKLRQEMQMVFQDPTSSLNPHKTIASIASLPLKIHTDLSNAARRKKVLELLDVVNLSEEYMPRYPSALSGGQKQRVGIARALILHPKLLVLDEPTAALDVSVQATILSLLAQVKSALELSYLFISHDLSLIRNIADRAMVMYLGKAMEAAAVERLFANPMHPYTKALLSSIPVVTEEEEKLVPMEITLKGDIPSPANAPAGCVFSTRCPERIDGCERIRPAMIQVENEHFVRCVKVNHEGGSRYE